MSQRSVEELLPVFRGKTQVVRYQVVAKKYDFSIVNNLLLLEGE